MAEQSAQHGQRLDDEMEHEVEALVRGAPVDPRAREELEFQPIEQVTVPLGDPEADEEHREIVERSELARFLRPSALPADADAVLAVATEEHAPDAVLTELAALPPGVQFATVAEIWEALGHETEHRDHVDVDGSSNPPPEEARTEEARTEEAAESVTVGEDDDQSREDEREDEPETVPSPPRPALVAPVPEPPSPGPVRGAVVFGFELVRAGLGVADRALETVERLISR
jgi:hypothetical protein